MNNKNNTREESKRPATLAVTGGVGSGKSVVCDRLKSHGIPVYSADELSREAVEPGTGAFQKIIADFGNDILLSDGKINRPMLRRTITRNPDAKKRLEGYIHPEVIGRMVEKFETARRKGDPVVGVEVPLLFEAGLQNFFDYVIMVSVNRQCRIDRVMARDGVLREEAEALMRIQMPEEEKRKQSDFVIDNNGSLADVNASVDRLYAQLVERIKKKPQSG